MFWLIVHIQAYFQEIGAYLQQIISIESFQIY